MCYHVKFGSSVTKAVHINRRKPSKPPRLWSAGSPAAPSLYVLSRQIWKGTPKTENTWAQPTYGRGVGHSLEIHLYLRSLNDYFYSTSNLTCITKLQSTSICVQIQYRSALVQLLDSIYHAADHGKATPFPLHLSAAFDTVDHTILHRL